jgi:hypothetical protein
MLNRIYYLLGRVLESKKKWELALNFYLKVPNNTTVNYRTAFCYKQRKDYGNAIYFFKKAISKEKTKAHWYLNLAESLSFLDKEDEALHYINLGLNLNHNNTAKHQKQIERISKKINQAIPKKDIFINSIIQIDSNSIEVIICGYTIQEEKNFQLQLSTRKNKIEISLFSHTIDLNSLKIDNEGIFEASFILSLNLLTIENSSIINHTWDFNLVINNHKTRLKYFQNSKILFTYDNFDIIPYQTNSKTFSIISIRKNTKIQQTDKKHITLIISRIHEETFFVQSVIKLSNILVSLKYNVTLVALDFKINQNSFPISPKINFNYISTTLLSDRERDIDFNSSDIIPSENYIKNFKNYFLTLKTDILYIPIFGEFILNEIILSIPNSTNTILAEYNKKRYISYLELLSNPELSVDSIINKVHTQHFFNNIETSSAIHLIYPEAKPLFEQITDKQIIATSLNEDNIREEWKNGLLLIDKSNEHTEDIFY